MSTPEELEAIAKQTAALYNAQNPDTGGTPEEDEARRVAAELANNQGSLDHDGNPVVREDTPEEIAAREAKAAEEAAKAAEEAKTPEEKAAEEAAEAEAKAKAKADAAANTDGEWMQSDSKEFNAAIGLMKAGGMTPAEAALVFDEAAQTGDMTKVDMELLVEKVGEDNAKLIMAGFNSYAEAEGQAVLQRSMAIQDAVGGPDNWAKMRAWARGKAPGDEAFTKKVTDLTALLNGDSQVAAELAAKEFMGMYNADANNSTVAPTPTKEVDVMATPAVQTKSTVEPLGVRAYSEAVMDANANLRGAALNAKLAELSRARAAGRAQGM